MLCILMVDYGIVNTLNKFFYIYNVYNKFKEQLFGLWKDEENRYKKRDTKLIVSRFRSRYIKGSDPDPDPEAPMFSPD